MSGSSRRTPTPHDEDPGSPSGLPPGLPPKKQNRTSSKGASPKSPWKVSPPPNASEEPVSSTETETPRNASGEPDSSAKTETPQLSLVALSKQISLQPTGMAARLSTRTPPRQTARFDHLLKDTDDEEEEAAQPKKVLQEEAQPKKAQQEALQEEAQPEKVLQEEAQPEKAQQEEAQPEKEPPEEQITVLPRKDKQEGTPSKKGKKGNSTTFELRPSEFEEKITKQATELQESKAQIDKLEQDQMLALTKKESELSELKTQLDQLQEALQAAQSSLQVKVDTILDLQTQVAQLQEALQVAQSKEIAQATTLVELATQVSQLQQTSEANKATEPSELQKQVEKLQQEIDLAKLKNVNLKSKNTELKKALEETSTMIDQLVAQTPTVASVEVAMQDQEMPDLMMKIQALEDEKEQTSLKVSKGFDKLKATISAKDECIIELHQQLEEQKTSYQELEAKEQQRSVDREFVLGRSVATTSQKKVSELKEEITYLTEQITQLKTELSHCKSAHRTHWQAHLEFPLREMMPIIDELEDFDFEDAFNVEENDHMDSQDDDDDKRVLFLIDEEKAVYVQKVSIRIAKNFKQLGDAFKVFLDKLQKGMNCSQAILQINTCMIELFYLHNRLANLTGIQMSYPSLEPKIKECVLHLAQAMLKSDPAKGSSAIQKNMDLIRHYWATSDPVMKIIPSCFIQSRKEQKSLFQMMFGPYYFTGQEKVLNYFVAASTNPRNGKVSEWTEDTIQRLIKSFPYSGIENQEILECSTRNMMFFLLKGLKMLSTLCGFGNWNIFWTQYALITDLGNFIKHQAYAIEWYGTTQDIGQAFWDVHGVKFMKKVFRSVLNPSIAEHLRFEAITWFEDKGCMPIKMTCNGIKALNEHFLCNDSPIQPEDNAAFQKLVLKPLNDQIIEILRTQDTYNQFSQECNLSENGMHQDAKKSGWQHEKDWSPEDQSHEDSHGEWLEAKRVAQQSAKGETWYDPKGGKKGWSNQKGEKGARQSEEDWQVGKGAWAGKKGVWSADNSTGKGVDSTHQSSGDDLPYDTKGKGKGKGKSKRSKSLAR